MRMILPSVPSSLVLIIVRRGCWLRDGGNSQCRAECRLFRRVTDKVPRPLAHQAAVLGAVRCRCGVGVGRRNKRHSALRDSMGIEEGFQRSRVKNALSPHFELFGGGGVDAFFYPIGQHAEAPLK